jgi:DNA repair protein RAD5
VTFGGRALASASSAKITALLAHLKRMRREDRHMKAVVFSQFTAFLDLIEPALRRARIRFLRFDGSMPQKQRAAVLAAFASASASASDSFALSSSSSSGASSGAVACVLLLSLRAGGVGLNLTHAQRVFLMDPWWSFAVEAQAIDRVHRMGQPGAVAVYRFIVRDSVEQRMLKIQERKKFM